MGQPWYSDFELHRDTNGVHITLFNSYAPLTVTLATMALAAASGMQGSLAPLAFALAFPLLFAKKRLGFMREGPLVTREVLLAGHVYFRSSYTLQPTDAAETKVIGDSIFLVQRPRWYRATLWSSSKSRFITLAATSDTEFLERLCGAVNQAIKEVCDKPSN